MPGNFLQLIDWGRPWLRHLRPAAELALEGPDWREALNLQAIRQQLRNHRGLPTSFVEQRDLPGGVAYEAFISNTGTVPTRENLHDFFNSLVWLTFPRTKARLNQLQWEAIEQASGRVEVRGALRDAATLFDENAALFITADPSMAEALRAHDWQKLFMLERSKFESGECLVLLFGHALMEKLVKPYKAITAHAWIIVSEQAAVSAASALQMEALDHALAGQLDATLHARRLTPLPVLGLPGWCEGQDEEFYADRAVFRPPRAKNT
ncbi:MAG: hypothetical protein K0S28_734 [Paucimonas sp.]|jgi:hypothetical protein|nr:hypothetical protein [Paucimonas sp.]